MNKKVPSGHITNNVLKKDDTVVAVIIVTVDSDLFISSGASTAAHGPHG